MSHTIVHPDGLHDPTPFGYSHTAVLPAGAELVFVSGQYGSDAEGAVVAPGFAEQVHRVFENLTRALAAHDLTPRQIVQLRTYVVSPDFERLGLIAAAVREACGPTPPTQTLIGVAGLALPDILVEVEAVAAR